MKLTREDERVIRAVVKRLNRLASVHGIEKVRRGVNRWGNAQRAKASLEKRKARLEAELAQVSRRLR